MKTILSILAIIICSMQAMAQVDRNTGSLALAGYNGTANVVIKDNFTHVQNGAQKDSFSISKSEKGISLTDSLDSSKMYSILGLTATQLDAALADQAGPNPISKLLDIASKMNGQKLIIQPANGAATNTETGVEEGAQPAVVVEEDGKNNWLMPGAIALAALVIGFFVGKAMQKPTKAPVLNEPAPLDAPIAENLSKSSKVSTKKLEQLTSEIEALQEKNRLVTEKRQQLIDGDNRYYTAIFERIILPLQTALDKGDEAEVIKYLNLCMVHLSSITRVKIKKKQNYDDANIQLIFGNASLTQDFPTIDAQTPIDKIPANLRALIQILQKSGVKGLDDTVIKGYKLNNL